MDYAKIYEDLIQKRRANPIDKRQMYCERHHYIPRCVGGGNESWNLVYLTAKEHFVAHHLLRVINPKNVKLLKAFIAMCTSTKRQDRKIYISAKRYERLKEDYANSQKEMFANMTPEDRLRRSKNIKAGCAKRTPEQKAKIKEKRMVYFASLTDEQKQEIAEKRKITIAAHSEKRKKEIFDNISRAHRKLPEELELRVVSEYQKGKTALEISKEPWCGLGREGVNYLLRRRDIKTHAKARWDGKIEQICSDFQNNKYSTRTELAKAYNTSWSTIHKILIENGVNVPVNTNYSNAARAREDKRIADEYVSYKAPFSSTCVTKISLYNAIERLRSLGLIGRQETQRNVLKKIRNALHGKVKYAFGYEWTYSRRTVFDEARFLKNSVSQKEMPPNIKIQKQKL